eukprot:6964880-Heterocapsa_arctica.AAC.1
MIAKFVEDKWDPIELYKKGYIPNHTKLKNLHGQLVNDRQRPDTLADYYEKTQWSNSRHVPITQDVIQKFKNNKAPGPSGVPIEAVKLLDDDSKLALLKLLNNCLRDRK